MNPLDACCEGSRWCAWCLVIYPIFGPKKKVTIGHYSLDCNTVVMVHVMGYSYGL